MVSMASCAIDLTVSVLTVSVKSATECRAGRHGIAQVDALPGWCILREEL